jgi:outer membrane immunogenic protein
MMPSPKVGGIAVDASAAPTRAGWTVTGADWAFAPWSATLEYDYHDVGTRGATLTSTIGTVVALAGLKDTIHTASAGMNYPF